MLVGPFEQDCAVQGDLGGCPTKWSHLGEARSDSAGIRQFAFTGRIVPESIRLGPSSLLPSFELPRGGRQVLCVSVINKGFIHHATEIFKNIG